MINFSDFDNIIWLAVCALILISVVCTIHFINTDSGVILRSKLTDNQVRIIKNYIMRMDGREFELFVAKLFRFKGYEVIVTPATNDKGKDLILHDYKGYKKTYVECKHYKEDILVGREIINKLTGASALDNVKSAIIITTSNYTKTAFDCKKQCNSMNLELWDMDDLLGIIDDMDELQLLNWFNIVIDGGRIIKTS